MAHFTLHYFPLAGNGHGPRLALAAVGANWKNDFITFDQWPAKKPSTPFGQLPVLEITEASGKSWQLAETHAIVRFIFRRFRPGVSEEDFALIDSLVERVYDLRIAFGKAAPFGDPERASKGQSFYDAEWATYNKQLDAVLARSTGPFLVGSQVSAADIVWFANLANAQALGIKVNISQPLQKALDAVAAIPGVAEFLKDKTKNPALPQ